MEVESYKCPACGAGLKFDSQTQDWGCEYCGSHYSLEQLQDYYKPQEDASWGSQAERAENQQWSEEEAQHLRVYNCPSCGAEIVTDDTTAATFCAYCGNPTLIPGQMEGSFRPQYIIPFQRTKEQAKEAYRSFCAHKPLLPRDFLNENHVDKITGIYVPYWLFDCDVDADIAYRAERVSTWREGNDEITRTEIYQLQRAGVLSFSEIPEDGSQKMDDDYMEAIEPFDYQELKPFEMAYLSGFQADKYDVSATDSVPRANDRIRRSTEQVFGETAQGYSMVTPLHSNIRLSQGEIRYAALPVWLLNTTYKGQSYMFAMNGQTGRLVGNLPVDRNRFLMFFASIAAGITAVSYLVTALIYLIGG